MVNQSSLHLHGCMTGQGFKDWYNLFFCIRIRAFGFSLNHPKWSQPSSFLKMKIPHTRIFFFFFFLFWFINFAPSHSKFDYHLIVSPSLIIYLQNWPQPCSSLHHNARSWNSVIQYFHLNGPPNSHQIHHPNINYLNHSLIICLWKKKRKEKWRGEEMEWHDDHLKTAVHPWAPFPLGR